MTKPPPAAYLRETTEDVATDSTLRKTSPTDIALIVVGNLVPLAGVLFFGWTLLSVVALFWAENLVVGAYALLRILTSMGSVSIPKQTAAYAAGAKAAFSTEIAAPRFPWMMLLNIPLAIFFTFHFGLFCFVHGVFVFSLFGEGGPMANNGFPFPPTRFAELAKAVAVMIVSYGIAFARGWILSGKFRRGIAAVEMFMPYGRIVVLHVTILIGGFAAMLIGAPVVALIFLIVLKTLVDVGLVLAASRIGPISSPAREVS